MKQTTITFSRRALVLLAAALACAPAWADNYFTLDGNDTLRVDPAYICGNRTNMEIPVTAHFDGRLNFWQVTITPPEDMRVTGIGLQPDQCPGLTVEYTQSSGTPTTYTAQMNFNLNDSITVSSFISVQGYWDYDNDYNYDSYGTVKWEAGEHTMFPVTCDFDPTFTGGTVTLRCILSSSYDARGGMVGYGAPVHSLHQVTVIVGYQRGDVNGDGIISALDLTSINDYLLTSSGLDQYQLEAADMNGDGNVSALDMSLLIDLLMTLT